MNYVSLCAQTTEDAREVYTSATSVAVRCAVLLPPIGNKAPTPLEVNIYGKAAERFLRIKKDAQIFIEGGKLRYDLETKSFSVHGGVIAEVTDAFPIFNTVILTGRCVKDIDHEDARAFKTTADGLMICNQTLSVSTGKNQADLFNFYAMNNAEDRYNQAELLVNFTRKGTGLTIQGKLVTDSWMDKETKQRKTNTKIMLKAMTLAPKTQESGADTKPSNQRTAASSEAQSLWGGKTADEIAEPYSSSINAVLPRLPGLSQEEDYPPF